jgi:uncharacterized hydantoinase/oxoprolinase family protein
MSRMVGADMEMFTQKDTVRLAEVFACRIRSRLVGAIHKVLRGEVPDRVVLCGSGVFLAADAANAALVGVPVIDLADLIGSEGSASACAHALIKLLNDME